VKRVIWDLSFVCGLILDGQGATSAPDCASALIGTLIIILIYIAGVEVGEIFNKGAGLIATHAADHLAANGLPTIDAGEIVDCLPCLVGGQI